jgi:hypothetical protein
MSLLGFVRCKFAAPGGWSANRSERSAPADDPRKAEKRIGDEWPVRTKPQAPRTLNCAILSQNGPYKFAISALRCKVPTRLLSVD